MEKTSYQEKEVSTSNTKRGQYSPRRKDTAPKVNPQLAVELIFQEIKRIEAFTKRIEDATQRKVQIDEKSLENAENSLKSVLSGFEKQSYRMKNGGYVDKRISLWTILCAVFSLLFAWQSAYSAPHGRNRETLAFLNNRCQCLCFLCPRPLGRGRKGYSSDYPTRCSQLVS